MLGKNPCCWNAQNLRQKMNELLQQFYEEGVRYLLIGGQAMRLSGMPRSTMDWDFFIPPRDEANFALLNRILEKELDIPLVALGPVGQNFVQTYQTSYGVLQFHLLLPGVRRFDEVEKVAVIRNINKSIPVKCLSGAHLLCQASSQSSARPG